MAVLLTNFGAFLQHEWGNSAEKGRKQILMILRPIPLVESTMIWQGKLYPLPKMRKMKNDN